MSKEKQCECCHEWWYASNIKQDLCPNCYDYFKQLKQQLAEKDKELIYMTKQAKKFNNEAQKYYEDAYCNGLQNQKAIAELEKVNTILYESHYKQIGNKYYTTLEDIENVISEQIELLKGEKNNG